MAYHRPGRIEKAVAGVAVRHGDPAADNGFVGEAVKTVTPSAETVRADLNLIAAGETYNMIVDGKIDVPATGLGAAVKGGLLFIDPDDNALALAQAGNNVVLGKIADLPGTHGGPSDRIRVNLNIKA